MPDVSAYRVLRDPKINLVPGVNHLRVAFTLPDNTNFGARAILAFVADPSSDASLSLEIEVNGAVVKSSNFTPGDPRGLWEVLGANALTPGDNEVRFTVPAFTTIRVGGKNVPAVAGGKLGISDIVLWYVVSIPANRPARSRQPATRTRKRRA